MIAGTREPIYLAYVGMESVGSEHAQRSQSLWTGRDKSSNTVLSLSRRGHGLVEEKGVLGDMSYRVSCVSYLIVSQYSLRSKVSCLTLTVRVRDLDIVQISEPASQRVLGNTIGVI